jgi:cell filamentation protein
MQHPYCYPGTDVLRNKENIRDNVELEAFERTHSADRLETLPRNLPISVAGYREIHRYMLQDVYDWAGEYRTVDTGRTAPFCKAEFIGRHMDARFAAINAEDNLRGLAPERFAARAAEHICELNAIHCFLDGNGRTQRAFLDALAAEADHKIDSRASTRRHGTRPRLQDFTRRITAPCKRSSPARSWSANRDGEHEPSVRACD